MLIKNEVSSCLSDIKIIASSWTGYCYKAVLITIGEEKKKNIMKIKIKINEIEKNIQKIKVKVKFF